MVTSQNFYSADEGSWNIPSGVQALRLKLHGEHGDGGYANTGVADDRSEEDVGSVGSGGYAVGYLTPSNIGWDNGDTLTLRPGTGPSGGAGKYRNNDVDQYGSEGAETQSGDGGNATAVYLNGDSSTGTTVLIVGGGGGASAAASSVESFDSTLPSADADAGNSGDGGLTTVGNGTDSTYKSDIGGTGGAGAGAGISDGSGEDGVTGEDNYNYNDADGASAVSIGGGGGGATNDGGAIGTFDSRVSSVAAGGSGGGKGEIGIASNTSGTLGGSSHGNGAIIVEYTDRVLTANAFKPSVDFNTGYVDISWDSIGSNEYKLYRSTSSQAADPSNYTMVADLGTNTSYRDRDVVEFQTYYYRVWSSATDSNLEPSMGNETSVTVNEDLGEVGRADNGVGDVSINGNGLTR